DAVVEFGAEGDVEGFGGHAGAEGFEDGVASEEHLGLVAALVAFGLGLADVGGAAFGGGLGAFLGLFPLGALGLVVAGVGLVPGAVLGFEGAAFAGQALLLAAGALAGAGLGGLAAVRVAAFAAAHVSSPWVVVVRRWRVTGQSTVQTGPRGVSLTVTPARASSSRMRSAAA